MKWGIGQTDMGRITMMYNPDEECEKMIAVIKQLCEQKGLSYYGLATQACF